MKTKGTNWKQRGYGYYILGAACIFVYYLPYLILGQDAAFRISDFLDDELVQYLLSGRYLFAANDAIVQEWLSGVPLPSIQPPSYLLIFFFKYLSFYHAVVLSSVFGTVCAYLGMYLLCSHLLEGKERYLSFMAAFLFCILPYYPSYGLSSVGIPLVVWACLKLCEGKRKWPYYAVLIFYALSSSLIWAGYFVVGFIFLAAVCLLCRKKKAIAGRLAIAGVSMTAVYCFVFRSSLASVLFGTMESHRSDPARVYAVQDFFESFWMLFKYGQYHVPSLHTYLMAFSLVVIVIGAVFYRKMNRTMQKRILLSGAIWVFALLIALFHGFYVSDAGYAFRSHLGGLESFQIDRIYWLYPTLWYTELALCASVFLEIGVGVLKWFLKKVTAKESGCAEQMGKVCGVAFCAVVTLFFTYYIVNHQNSVEYHSNVRRALVECGLRDGAGEDYMMSYHEFYDHELFAQVRDSIGKEQSSYRVGCLGFVPAIATINGFYTVDGYSTNYPLEYKYEFREVIARELEKSEELRQYYDNWGSRCYLFSAELGIKFQIEKQEEIVIHNLEINTAVLKELGCEYILSAVCIENASDLELVLLDVFSGEDSAIEIYVYELR